MDDLFPAPLGNTIADLGSFRETVLAVAARHFPTLHLTRVDGNALRYDDYTLFLDNLLAEVSDLPDECREGAIVTYLANHTPEAVRAFQSMQTACEAWDIARPLLRPRLYALELKDYFASLIWMPFPGGLLLTYTLDLGPRDVSLHESLMRGWDVSLRHVHEQALANLEAMSDSLVLEATAQPSVAGRWLMVNIGDGYDAARILVPSFQTRILALLARDAAMFCVPSRDLLVCWSDDYGAHEELRAGMEEACEGLAYRLSDTVFDFDRAGIHGFDRPDPSTCCAN